jgi:hypothetical protein
MMIAIFEVVTEGEGVISDAKKRWRRAAAQAS